jgi:(p)ppGpp synthase/HD superfamily hydrolase
MKHDLDLANVVSEAHKKRLLVLRHLFVGAGFYEALAALEFASLHHVGTRKDGVTPEFDHQIQIALHAFTLPDLIHREATMATIMLHDVPEDYNVSSTEVRSIFSDRDFAIQVSEAVTLMTKTFRGRKLYTPDDAVRDGGLPTEAEFFDRMAENAIASIGKLCDRVHNMQSMVGVFTKAKQAGYVEEVERLFLPMLKAAKRKHPRQTLAYENLKWSLSSQVELIKAALKAD